MKNDLRQALGASRYLEYERAIDPSYQMVRNYSDQHALSENTAEDVYRIQRVAEAQAFSVRENTKMTAEQRVTALGAIQRETEKEVARVLDEEQFRRFQQSNAAGWLNRLQDPYHANSEPIIDRAFSPH